MRDDVRVTYRTTAQATIGLVVGGLFCLGVTSPAAGGPAGVRIALASVVFLGFILLASSRVVTGSTGVVIWNGLRRHALAWSDIDRFEIGKVAGLRLAATATLNDGNRFWIWGVLPTKTPSGGKAARIVDALNAELERASGAA